MIWTLGDPVLPAVADESDVTFPRTHAQAASMLDWNAPPSDTTSVVAVRSNTLPFVASPIAVLLVTSMLALEAAVAPTEDAERIA